jgi:ketosteroid isomerase-like protein
MARSDSLRPVNENADLIRRLFGAFAAGDLEAIHAALADTVRSHTPGESRLAGTVVGREAVVAHLGRSRELSDGTYEVQVEDVLGGDGHAAAVYRGQARRSGRQLDVRHIALYRIERGRIAEIWFTPLDQTAFDEFWS